MKKFLLVFVGALLIILILVGFWFLLTRNNSTDIEPATPFEGETGFGDFFDIESGGNIGFEGFTETLDEEDFIAETQIPILRQLSAEPVAGYTFFKKEFDFINPNIGDEETEGESTIKEDRYVFRFMERATGHIFETAEHTLTTEKITNTTTQQVYNAIFSNEGQYVVFEKTSATSESVDSFVGEIIEKEIETTTDENILLSEETEKEFVLEIEPYSIVSNFFVSSPSKNSFAYIISSNDSASITTDSFTSRGKESIFNSPIKEWQMDWKSDSINLTTKPSSKADGVSYLLNTNTGSLNKLIGGIKGLTTNISQDGETLLYSESSGNSVVVRVQDVVSGEASRLAISTLPEKCVFSKTRENIIYCGAQSNSTNASLPDDWYKGKVSFRDSIWEINTENNFVSIFYNFDENKFGEFDLINLDITEGDEYLTFVNKKDLTLWSLNLSVLNNEDSFSIDSPEDF
jgi:hypothetical protein